MRFIGGRLNAAMLILAAVSGMGHDRTELGHHPLPPPPEPPAPKKSSPSAVTCPRCKAASGEPCDPRTLGRYPYHKARVDAVAEMHPPTS